MKNGRGKRFKEIQKNARKKQIEIIQNIHLVDLSIWLLSNLENIDWKLKDGIKVIEEHSLFENKGMRKRFKSLDYHLNCIECY